MADSSRKKTVILIGLILLILSVISIHIATIFYPGGTFIDNGTVGYSFWYNFFSDLGMTVSHSGAPNPIGFVLTTIFLITTGVAQIAVYSVLPSLYADSKKTKWTSILGTVFGICTGTILIVASFVPEDINPDLHLLLAQYMYMALMLSVALYTIATFWNKDFSLKYTLCFLSIAIVLFLFLFIGLVMNPDPFTSEGLFILAVGQKIVNYTLWIGFIPVVYGIWKRMD